LGKKNIIFGISKEELANDDKDKFQFCKTFRKLLLEDDVKELPESVDVIAFYGHSLNNQDSNYFFAQFDKYDIYNDTTKHKVKLVFYEKKGFPIHDKVFNLLKRYEERVNNKNVIQKLQLENRLLIKKID
jgi:TPP-dependent 2-oxoacid decarboxylase